MPAGGQVAAQQPAAHRAGAGAGGGLALAESVNGLVAAAPAAPVEPTPNELLTPDDVADGGAHVLDAAVPSRRAPSTPRVEESAEAAAEAEEDDERVEAARPPALAAPRPPRRRVVSVGGLMFSLEGRFSPQQLLGKGAYGIVCSTLDHKTGDMVCSKTFLRMFDNTTMARRSLRELKFLRLLKHDQLLSLRRAMRPSGANWSSVTFVTELMEADLGHIIQSAQELTPDHVQFFMYQILLAVKYMHTGNVMHRDLKPRNILVNSDCSIKVGDMGLARLCVRGSRRITEDMAELYGSPERDGDMELSDYVQSRWYRAPEVLAPVPDEYGKPIDIWSVGCVFAELFLRKPLFTGTTSNDQLLRIMQLSGTRLNLAGFSPEQARHIRSLAAQLGNLPPGDLRHRLPNAPELALDLLRRMLAFNPRERIRVEEALQHPYFGDLHDPTDEPSCMVDLESEFEFDLRGEKLSVDEYRALILREIEAFNPEDRCPCGESRAALAEAAALADLGGASQLRRVLAEVGAAQIFRFVPCWCADSDTPFLNFIELDSPARRARLEKRRARSGSL
jgi:serine/threonine protein kinase